MKREKKSEQGRKQLVCEMTHDEMPDLISEMTGLSIELAPSS